jgi:Protein of unknown function (DUF3667)
LSHLQERTEKNCLNCNAQVHGKFCHICGQENYIPKESFWHLATHFFEDLTHFDGKFFTSLKLLITRPGFLSTEYLRGKRNSYLNPIRMYIFTSAIFFLIFFSFIVPKPEKEEKATYSSTKLINKLTNQKIQLQKELEATKDSTELSEIKNDIKLKEAQIIEIKKDSIAGLKYFIENEKKSFTIFTTNKFKSLKQYDSVQKTLPINKQDGFIKKTLITKSLSVDEKYADNRKTLKEKILDSFFHKFPQILFISLPIFALLLKLLYIRRKEIFYVNHVIYTIHLYVFTFIGLLINFGLQAIEEKYNSKAINLLNVLAFIGILFYQYKAMRNFYNQKRIKTIIKFLLLNFLSLFVIIILFFMFFVLSFFQL